MPPKDPLVTVVVPVFNAERWIGRTLSSASNQSYSLLDIVVVDDGSTDRSAVIIEEMASNDARIRLLRQQNAGVSAARNVGIAQARGELIAPLDADDLWHAEKIARQVEVMRSVTSKVGLVYCWTVEIDENDCLIPPVRDNGVASGNVLLDVVGRAGIITSGANPLIRRSYLEAVGGYDSTVEPCEDWKLQLNLAEICEFAVIPEYLVGYRRSASSASKNVRRMAGSMEKVADWLIQRWPDMPGEVKQRMNCHRYSYLAHLSLINNNFLDAIRYEVASLTKQRRHLVIPEALTFGLRLLARLTRLRRFRWAFRSEPTSFNDFSAGKSQANICR